MSAPAPPLLDAAAIAARIPHAGRMSLLQRVVAHDARRIECASESHRDAAHPLRDADGTLPAAAAIEYASQAMALHGALAAADGTPPAAGFLAALRAVTLHVATLDAIDGDLIVAAELLAGDARQARYAFALRDEHGAVLAEGRATVILDALPR